MKAEGPSALINLLQMFVHIVIYYAFSEFSTRIVLVGGEGQNGKKTEIIDLIDPRLKCDFLTDTRLQWASVGGLVENLPLICGGETDDGFGNKIVSNECYPKTSLAGKVFDMDENRRYAASVVLNNDTLFVR